MNKKGLDFHSASELEFSVFGVEIAVPINRRICPKCGKPTKLLLQPGGKGPRTHQCIDCDRPDPIKSPRVQGLIKALLHEEKR